MQQSTSTILSLAGAFGLFAAAVAILVAEVRTRRSGRQSLDYPLEMSTLTFPPGSLARRSTDRGRGSRQPNQRAN
jgi:hypothetical protein